MLFLKMGVYFLSEFSTLRRRVAENLLHLENAYEACGQYQHRLF